MELLLVVAVWSIIVKKAIVDGAVDVAFAVRGKPSPRWGQDRTAKWRARTSGPASEFLRQLWRDSWEDASAKRAAKRAAREAPASPTTSRRAARRFFGALFQNQRRAVRDRWDARWERAEERLREKATRPRPGQVTVPGTVVPNAQDEDRPQDGDGDGDRPDPQPVPDGDEDEDWTDLRDERPTAVQDEDEQDSGPDSGPDQDISPIAGPTTQEGPTMTTTIPTGEVTSLSQTIRFCEDSAQAYRAQAHAIEQTQATLTAEEVSGPAAAAFALAMEQSFSAADAMTTAAEEFKKHLVVLEAYDAVQGAGTKAFVTGTR